MSARDDIKARYRLVDSLRPAICDWLRTNGIDYNAVPELAVPKIENGRIHVKIFATNDNGRRYIDPATGRAAVDFVTVPLKVEPPALLADWLFSR